MQEEVSIIEGQVSQLKGLVQQQDALNAVLQQRVQTSGEAESRAKVAPIALSILLNLACLSMGFCIFCTNGLACHAHGT